jgi:hypothetical protein
VLEPVVNDRIIFALAAGTLFLHNLHRGGHEVDFSLVKNHESTTINLEVSLGFRHVVQAKDCGSGVALDNSSTGVEALSHGDEAVGRNGAMTGKSPNS